MHCHTGVNLIAVVMLRKQNSNKVVLQSEDTYTTVKANAKDTVSALLVISFYLLKV